MNTGVKFSKPYISTIAICMLILLSCLLFCGTDITAYTMVISEDLGVSRTGFSIYFTIRAVISAALIFKLPDIMKRLPLKILIILGLGALAATLGLLSLSVSMPAVYAAAIFGGIGNTFAGAAPVSIIVKKWFQTSQGIVLSMVMSASSVGGIIINPLLSSLIEKTDWRLGFTLLCAVTAAIFIVTAFSLKVSPEEVNLLPFGAVKADVSDKTVHVGESGRPRLSGRDTDSANMRSLILISILYSFGSLNLYSYCSSVLTDLGFSVPFSTGVAISVISAAALTGKIGMGFINDKLGTGRMLLMWYGLCPVAALYFIIFRGDFAPTALIGVVLIGLTAGIYSVPVPLACMRLYKGSEAYAYVVSLCTASTSLVSAVSGMIFHSFYDLSGTYIGALLFSLALAVLCFIMVIGLVRKNKL